VVTTILSPYVALYSGSRAASEAFSGVLAAELAVRKITVNRVLPSAVETQMYRTLPQELQVALEQRTPLGVGAPRDIAGICAFLASDEGRWITSEKIRCDGGIR
jgi:3-oxoacyl-[acyl-carrier protein] reductase